MSGQLLQSIAGFVCIAVGLIVILLSKWLADVGVSFQRSIGSPFAGSTTFWVERIGGVVLGMGVIGFGILLLLGVS